MSSDGINDTTKKRRRARGMGQTCTDCCGSTPGKDWKRCLRCAHHRLRMLLSPTPIPPLTLPRVFNGKRVAIVPLPHAERSAPQSEHGRDIAPGERVFGIVRRTVDRVSLIWLDDGGKYYAREDEIVDDDAAAREDEIVDDDAAALEAAS